MIKTLAQLMAAWLAAAALNAQAFQVTSFPPQGEVLQIRQLVVKFDDSAIVVLDNATGNVLAWVGSSDALSDAADVDGVTALRAIQCDIAG